MKYKIILLITISAFLSSCDALFDKGDVEKVYDGNVQVELKPLQNQTSLSDGGTEIAVQLIGKQRTDDLAVNFIVEAGTSDDNAENAEEGTHYTIVTPTPAVIKAGTSSTTIEIDYIDGSVPENGEVYFTVTINGTDADDVEPAANLNTSTTYIAN